MEALDDGIRLQHLEDAVVQLAHVDRVVGFDARPFQQRSHGVRLEPAEALAKVIVLRVERRQDRGAGAVLLPLVLPEAVRLGLLLHVRPLLLQFGQQRFDLVHVERHGLVAVEGTVLGAVTRGPNAVHGPGLGGGWQLAGVRLVAFLVLVASGLGPALGEQQKVKVMIGGVLRRHGRLIFLRGKGVFEGNGAGRR